MTLPQAGWLFFRYQRCGIVWLKVKNIFDTNLVESILGLEHSFYSELMYF